MKKVVLIFTSVLALSICFVACSKSEKKSTTSNNSSNSRIERLSTDPMISFTDAGDIHNNILSYITANLSGTSSETYDAVEYRAKQLGLDYLSNNPTQIDGTDLTEGFTLRPSSVSSNNVTFTNTNWATQANTMIQQQQTIGFISTAERNEIIELMSFLDSCKANQSDSATIVNGISQLITNWNSKNHDYQNGDGTISGYCLYIALSSAKMWSHMANVDQSIEDVTPNGIAPWVAADAAGALGGAIGAGLDSYSSTGHVNWKSVGAWAVGGAIASSCVGPVGRVLTKIFG